MASRVKEDEKNERVIRGLLKLPENKRCINCNSLGPQYVCITFWTFVCTNCGGIHREFTHRVKSVSMANFTSQEVTALQEGGNQRVKDIYFKGMDQQRQSLPDGSNVEQLRDFIRNVYVNKRYTNEKSDEKPPRGQMGDKNDHNETRSSSGSRSPPYEDTYDRRYSDRSSPGERSPGFEPGSRKFGDFTKSPSRPEVVNDWRREDRFGGGRKSEEGSRSPEQVKDFGSSSPPVARPVREILSESVAPLRIAEPPKPEVNRTIDVSSHAKKTVSSSSLTSTNENSQGVKLEPTASLIDFDDDPEPSVAPAVVTQAPQLTTSQPVAQPTSSSNDNWASFDNVPSVNISQARPSGNMVDSLLSQLEVSSSVPVQTSGLPSGPGAATNMTTFPTNPSVVGQWPGVQQSSPSLLPAHLGHHAPHDFAPPLNGPSSGQPWNTGFASNVQRSVSAPPSLQPLLGGTQGATSGGLQSSEVKPSGRTELPADLFTVTYPSYHHAAVPGWQTGPRHGMGYGMQQYNASVPFQNFQQPAKSVNPFDFSNEPPSQNQTATQFPSMASMQGALPNTLPPSGMMRTSSLGAVSQAWMPSQGVHNSPGLSGHPSAMPPRYMSPQVPGNIPPSNMSAPYGYGNQQTGGHHFGSPFAAPPSNPPSGGNPFG